MTGFRMGLLSAASPGQQHGIPELKAETRPWSDGFINRKSGIPTFSNFIQDGPSAGKACYSGHVLLVSSLVAICKLPDCNHHCCKPSSVLEAHLRTKRTNGRLMIMPHLRI